jgi:Tfp pilus assembly protein PilO
MKNIIESFNKLNDQSRYAILVVVFFAIILVDVLFLVLPQMASIDTVNAQIKQLSDDTDQALTNKNRINPLKKNLLEANDELKSLSVKVRLLQEVPAILSTVSSIANEYGVKIDQLVPEKSQQELLTTVPDGKYYALPVVIKARCGYHKFGRFLSKLENQDMYFVIKDFIIQNDDKDPSTQLFSLTINIILLDRSAASAKSL